MKFHMSDRERFAVAVLLNAAGQWGGADEETLLALDDVWSGLRLDEFDAPEWKDRPESDIGDELRPFSLGERAGRELLKRAVSTPGQNRKMGRISAALARRLRQALPKEQPAKAGGKEARTC